MKWGESQEFWERLKMKEAEIKEKEESGYLELETYKAMNDMKSKKTGESLSLMGDEKTSQRLRDISASKDSRTADLVDREIYKLSREYILSEADKLRDSNPEIKKEIEEIYDVKAKAGGQVGLEAVRIQQFIEAHHPDRLQTFKDKIEDKTFFQKLDPRDYGFILEEIGRAQKLGDPSTYKMNFDWLYDGNFNNLKKERLGKISSILTEFEFLPDIKNRNDQLKQKISDETYIKSLDIGSISNIYRILTETRGDFVAQSEAVKVLDLSPLGIQQQVVPTSKSLPTDTVPITTMQDISNQLLYEPGTGGPSPADTKKVDKMIDANIKNKSITKNLSDEEWNKIQEEAIKLEEGKFNSLSDVNTLMDIDVDTFQSQTKEQEGEISRNNKNFVNSFLNESLPDYMQLPIEENIKDTLPSPLLSAAYPGQTNVDYSSPMPQDQVSHPLLSIFGDIFGGLWNFAKMLLPSGIDTSSVDSFLSSTISFGSNLFGSVTNGINSLLGGKEGDSLGTTVSELASWGYNNFKSLASDKISQYVTDMQSRGWSPKGLSESTLNLFAQGKQQLLGLGNKIGGVVWPPVSGKLSSLYGMRKHPITGKWKLHEGIDISQNDGAPIHAVMGGQVVLARNVKGYGNMVSIKTGPFVTKYAHMKTLPAVIEGQTVKAGDILGNVGSTGNSTGSHLHFGIDFNGTPVDPQFLFSPVSSGSFNAGSLTGKVKESWGKLSEMAGGVYGSAKDTISSAWQRLTNTESVKNIDPRIREAVDIFSKENKINPAVVYGMIEAESSFIPTKVSPAGAKGLMQLMPGTAREMGVYDSFDITQNIKGGTGYFRKMLDLFNQDTNLALAAYNWGPTKLKNNNNRTIPKIEEYVRRVINFSKKYQGLDQTMANIGSSLPSSFESAWQTPASMLDSAITTVSGYVEPLLSPEVRVPSVGNKGKKYIVWHTAADPRHGGAEDTTAKEINQWHLDRGWKKGGYNNVIRKGGMIEHDPSITRSYSEIPAHVKGLNEKSIGYCFSGHGDKVPLTPQQLESGIALTLRDMKNYGIPTKNVIGHREALAVANRDNISGVPNPGKTCPGTLIKIRSQIDQKGGMGTGGPAEEQKSPKTDNRRRISGNLIKSLSKIFKRRKERADLIKTGSTGSLSIKPIYDPTSTTSYPVRSEINIPTIDVMRNKIRSAINAGHVDPNVINLLTDYYDRNLKPLFGTSDNQASDSVGFLSENQLLALNNSLPLSVDSQQAVDYRKLAEAPSTQLSQASRSNVNHLRGVLDEMSDALLGGFTQLGEVSKQGTILLNQSISSIGGVGGGGGQTVVMGEGAKVEQEIIELLTGHAIL